LPSAISDDTSQTAPDNGAASIDSPDETPHSASSAQP
jgi:hypothetical protein